jgi:hypothetical protein
MQSTKERAKYYDHNNKTVSGGKRLDIYRYVSLIIDGMDQAKTRLPHWDRAPKYMDDKQQVDLHLNGCLLFAHGIGENYCGTECHVHWNVKQSFRDDSNATCSMLESMIKRVQSQRVAMNKPLPEVLYIQLDNVGSNKNHWLLGYACWLVQEGIFAKIKINFLLVGHTHENIDQFFSRLSVALNAERAFTLDQMISIVKKCSTPSPMCHVLTQMIDVKKWLDDGKCSQSHNIQKSHIFRIKKNEHGIAVVQSKQYSTSAFYGPELRMLPTDQIPDERYIVFPRPIADHENDEESDSKTLIDKLRTTASLLQQHEPEGWDEEAKQWWDTFLDDLASHQVRPDRVRAEPHGLLPCVITPLARAPTVEDETLTADEVELVVPTFRDISSQANNYKQIARRCADPTDMQVGTMVCVLPDQDQEMVANNDRARDLVTPIWVGKVRKLINDKEIEIHWYGADFGASSSNTPLPQGEEAWGKWRWTPRYKRERRSVPVTTIVDRYKCGLLAYDFELRKSQPKHALNLQAVTLIRERYADAQREAALLEEDL